MPETIRKPGRPRKSEIEGHLAILAKHDQQIRQEHDTWLEIDISTPAHPDTVMKIDKVDYERLKNEHVGRFFVSSSTGSNSGPVAVANTRKKDGRFYEAPSCVHDLICKGKGFIRHRNGDPLDNRRANLETDTPLQASTVGATNNLKAIKGGE